MSAINKFKTPTEFLFLAIGSIVAAFAIEEFLVPCTILDGGVVGVGIIINNLTKFPLGLITILLNIPFLLIGSRKMGKMFIIKSAFAMTCFSIALGIFARMENATEDYLLAVSFGGVILGIGVGTVIKSGGCLDGTETIAILINKKFNLPVGQVVLAFNVIIFTIAGFIFDFDRAMYSLLTYFITSRILDMVDSGLNNAKAAFIITNDAKEIADKIYTQLGRTVTIMEGEGMVSGPKVVLYCVLTRFEVHELKDIINNVDSSAFITVSDVSEIIGNHIKSSKKLDEPKK